MDLWSIYSKWNVQVARLRLGWFIADETILDEFILGAEIDALLYNGEQVSGPDSFYEV